MTIFELITSIEIGLVYGIVAIGIYLTFRVIDFPDLSCDGSFVLGSATSAMLIQSGCDPYLSLLAATVAASIAGLITAILNLKFKISNLLSGIIVAFMLYSINLRAMGNIPNISLSENITIFTYSNPILMLILMVSLIVILIAYFLSTDLGLALRVIGQNKKLALNIGINTSIMTATCLILSNGLIGLGGGIFTQYQGFADVSSGAGTVLIGFAAVIIGEKILPFKGMIASVLSCIIGSIAYRILVAFALRSEWLGLESQDLNLITGIMIIVIMIVPNLRASMRGRSC